MCDSNGAVVYQEMCMEVEECNHWEGEKVRIFINTDFGNVLNFFVLIQIGLLHLSNCKYACKDLPTAYPIYLDTTSTSPSSIIEDEDYDTLGTDDGYSVENEVVIGVSI